MTDTTAPTDHAPKIRSMLWAAVRDLQWRFRRVVIAVLSTAMVFALTLILAGLATSFKAEAGRTVKAFGADRWIVRDGVHGPFTTVNVLPVATADVVAHLPGVRRADPVLTVHETVRTPAVVDLNVVGFRAGGLGTPRIRHGRLPSAAHEMVVDNSLPHARIGEQLQVSGVSFTVVGTTGGLSINGGEPMGFAALDDVEALVFPGARVASAIVTRGVPTLLPPGLTARTPQETTHDTLRIVANPVHSLEISELLMLSIAGLVIGSVVYLSALERQRDFAVLKATGASSRSVFLGLAAQSTVLAVMAALIGTVAAHLMVPLFPLHFAIPASASLLLPAEAIAIGLLASVAGVRRAVRVDPALAFAGA